MTAASVDIEVDERDMSAGDDMWPLRVSRAGKPFRSCSGVPSDDHCGLEITCSGDMGDDRLSYALTLELGETGTLEGSSVVTVTGESGGACQAQFQLEGEHVSRASEPEDPSS